MAFTSIHRFTPFTLDKAKDYTVIQNIVNYAESRFWSILDHITRADIDRQTWLQKLLHRELVHILSSLIILPTENVKMFVLSSIGTATAVGQPLVIPIIIRSLADSMMMLDETRLPIACDPGLLLTLDIGAGDPDNKSRLVETYRHNWWTGRKPRDLNAVGVLDATTFEECLEHYQRQCPADGPTTGPATTTGSNPTSNTTGAGPSHSNASTGRTSFANPSALSCQKCEQYRNVISDLLREILKFHTFSTAMSTASGNQWHLGMRRASTFHQLHEAALLKETGDPAIIATAPATGSVPARARASQAIATAAAAELTRLQQLPASAHKWIWGQQLTAAEVLGLRRRGSRPGPAPHTGYDISMAEGRLNAGEGSDWPPSICSGGHEDVPADVSIPPPPTTFTYPGYFESNDQLIYDPLHISASSIPQLLHTSPPDSVGAAAVVKDASALPGGDIGPVWTFGGGDHDASVQWLAQQWSSASEDEGQPAPARSISPSRLPMSEDDEASVTRLAQEWTSGSEDEGEPAPARPILDSGSAMSEHDQASVKRLAEEWTSGSEEGNAGLASAPGSPTRPVPPPGTRLSGSSDNALLAHQWTSGSESDEEGPARSLADAWTSGSDDDDPSTNMLTQEGTLGSDADDVEPAPDVIPSESGDSEDDHGSQFVVSPSRITIASSAAIYLDSDHHFPSSDNSTPASSPVATPRRTYGPSDFAYLQDHMFELESSDEEGSR